MALEDAFFTPSILITLAICLILVSALGLFFIQKLNQQNHKINTMFDLVNTLAQEVSAIKNSGPSALGGETPHMSYGGNIQTEMKFQQKSNNINYNEDSDNIHTIQMIDVSDDDTDAESSDDNENSEDAGESTDDEESNEDNDSGYDEESNEDDESDDDESDDDEEEENQHKDTSSIKKIVELGDNIHEIQSTDIEFLQDVELKPSTLGNDMTNLSNLMTDDIESIEGDELEVENVKNLDIVLDYKKASLSKLREIVTNKGIINDASKMKKAELLKLLEAD